LAELDLLEDVSDALDLHADAGCEKPVLDRGDNASQMLAIDEEDAVISIVRYPEPVPAILLRKGAD
jgi:hypothetical protein